MHMNVDPKDHWEGIYKKKPFNEVSWYSPHLEKSLEIILELGLPRDAHIIDVGGGASTLPDDLLAEGFRNITVLDISSEALKVSKDRLGIQANLIRWIEADVTQTALDPGCYDLWHDRAVFHFLTSPQDRRCYIDLVSRALKPGGYLLIATFGPNGPLKCSGLEIVRYSKETLGGELGKAFQIERSHIETHTTPFETSQEFLYCLLRKVK